MNKYYADIQAFYAKEDVVYNPTLAMYMKEVLLKFHSCLYISSGYSTHQLLNPRYYIKPYNKRGTEFMTAPNILDDDGAGARNILSDPHVPD